MLEQGKIDKHTSLSRQDVNKKFYNKGQWCKDKDPFGPLTLD